MPKSMPEKSDVKKSSVGRRAKPKPFQFFALPSELRIRVYELLLTKPYIIDLDPSNYYKLAPCLGLFLVNRRMYEEAWRIFFRSNTFRLFPIPHRFINTKKPLLVRIPAKYRAEITKLDLRLGPGFTKPPKCWVVTPQLGLEAMASIRLLKIFVEIDPASSDIFEGFRKSKDFYTQFCVDILKDLYSQVASLRDVEFDAFPSVSREAPLMKALLQETRNAKKRIFWGPDSGWDDESNSPTAADLEQSLALLSLNENPIPVH